MRKSFNELFAEMQERQRQVEQGQEPPDAALTLERTRQELRRTMGCPDEEALSGLADGQLRRTNLRRWFQVWRHVYLRRCQHCREAVKELGTAVKDLDAAVGSPGGAPVWLWSFMAAEAVAIVLLGSGLLLREGYHRGREVERQTQFRLEVQQILDDGRREAIRLLTWQARAQARQVLEEVQRLQVVPAVADGQTYLYLTSRQARPTSAVTLAAGLASTPALKTEYEAYMRQWGEVLRALGGVLFEARKIPEAIRVFEYLVNARPEPKTPQEKAELLGFMYALGELYKANQDHRAAMALYDEILTRGLAPSDPRPAHYAGWSAYQRGDYDAALRYYDVALRIDPDYAKVWYNKALVFQAQGRETLYQEHLAQALALTLQAYDREGDKNPRVPFTLGILYATRGELDAALRYVEQALRRDQLYVVRAEDEPAFRVFQTQAPYDARFQALLDAYRPPQGKFGASSEATYDPSIFNE